jgi:hypothetical protein
MKYLKPINEMAINQTKLNYSQYLSPLKELKSKLSLKEVINWLNDNNVDYYGWSDLDMYIYYIENQ